MDPPKAPADGNDRPRTPSRSPSRGVPSPLNSPRRSPGPHTSAQMEQILVGADRLERMILAHELATDSSFKVGNITPQEGTIEAKVKATIEQAFWDALQSSLSLVPPDLTHALVLLEEIRETLLSFLPDRPGLQMRELIKENLDLDHIKAQASQNALDFREKAQFIISIMGRLCAPARDDEIKQLSTIEEIVPLFREVFHVLEEMKVDMLNFTLQQVRPIIDQHSVEYEQQMFDEFLVTQEEPLCLTKTWLRLTATELLQLDEGSRSPSLSPPPAGSGSLWKVSPTRLIRWAYLNLLDWNNGPYPETLTADIPRLVTLQTEAETVVISASVLLMLGNAIGSRLSGAAAVDLRTQVKNDVIALVKSRADDDRDVMVAVAEHVVSHTQRILDGNENNSLGLDLAGLKNQIADLYRKDHPVRLLLMKRVKDSIEVIVSAGKTDPPSQNVPSALVVVQSEILHIANLFSRIISRNQVVFGKYYSELIISLADELGLRTVNSTPSPVAQQA